MTDTLPTATAGVHYDQDGGVATVTLDRESALNAFDAAQYDATHAALGRAADTESVRCVLIAARGRAFSAGSDLQDESPDPDAYERFISRLEGFPKPVVAAVNGLAVGIGATLLGHCDVVIASTEARFKLPFAAIGLVPEAGSTVTLPAAMGPQAAAHALFTGGWVGAADAERAGLVWRVVEPDALAGAAAELCAQIAAQPVESLTATKELLLAARLPAARAAREREEAEFTRMLAGEAHRRALEQFRAG
ncbi:MAG: enoyl-CoA hydratase/isomerase family protein, partial [Solirubrobacterales bacterium]|nr:enoyl-CoA hydratase/isomerase family protein [Solirubrobacterales bacterium]